ncbi:MAG: F0F1 ATP synthase subunit B [Ruminobacter sp.]|jgi:F-type H+-transporting ATPase subunit b|nr:F0F1 ATP synthase subunit B [Ruminobacter sp.]
MDINMGFIVQMIAFLIFVTICKICIWPVILDRITERQKEIKKSLDKAREAIQQIEVSKLQANDIINNAKQQASEIVDDAKKRKDQIIDQATSEAKVEKEKIINTASAEIESEKNRAKEELRKSISDLVVMSSEKIMQKKINADSDNALIDDILKQL